MSRWVVFGLWWALSGCLVSPSLVDDVLDRDGDGHLHEDADGGDDCDDLNPDVAPGLAERCGNGVDDDCDGVVDDDGVGAVGVYVDADLDGFGDEAEPRTMCEVTTGFAALAGDCNDADAAAFPGGAEVCNRRDDDCDQLIDEGAAGALWYFDGDGDGFGEGDGQAECEAPNPSWVRQPGDCDDARPDVAPGAPDAWYDGVDADCAGDDDFDADADGARDPSAWAPDRPPPDALVDCDDADARRAPQLPEVWYDGFDQDCDPLTEHDQDADGVVAPPLGEDCDDLNAAVGGPQIWYADLDADGWGSPYGAATTCVGPAFFVQRAGDCDDAAPAVHEGALESCDGVDDDCDGEVDESLLILAWPDADLDGFGDDARGPREACAPLPSEARRGGDCDDRRPDVNVTAAEVCDAVDNDCDGVTDEEVRVDVWPDRDGDGRGDATQAPEARCVVPPGYVLNALDCDDVQSAIFFGAVEGCDGLDNDCDGATDEGLLVSVWPDLDRDGVGALGPAQQACAAGPLQARLSGDCDDASALAAPGLAEGCDGVDNDCDGEVDEALLIAVWPDADQDGWGDDAATPEAACAPGERQAAVGGDCDDAQAAVRPLLAEACDGLDNDCDAEVDEGLRVDVWPDVDRDGFGDAGAVSEAVCAWTSGRSAVTGDCDDGNAVMWPGNAEVCDGYDNDCDGAPDDGLLFRVWPDRDQDGWGDDAAGWEEVCALRPLQAGLGGDCDDAQALAHPGNREVCDGVDNDCDAATDEGVQRPFWPDADHDLHGDALAEPAWACEAPVGFAADDRDCDDADADAHQDRVEVCDGVDNDCDGAVDEGVTRTVYLDADRDTYGDPSVPARQVCVVGDRQAQRAGDCDDADPSRNPTAFESCDGRDQNCDGVVDNGLRVVLWPDRDQDGYGDAGVAGASGCPAVGRAPNGLDCDDANAERRPGASEVCDGADDDCDRLVDEGVQVSVWADVDRDGWGANGAPVLGCPSVDWVQTTGDCADRNPARNPGATELCDAIDQDCDGSAENGLGYTGLRDWDGDGYGDPGSTVTTCDPNQIVGVGGDCDDRQPLANPGELERCDGLDNDCDGSLDEGTLLAVWRDRDGDGWGDDASLAWRCEVPSGGVTADGDCDDANAAVRPDAAEVCDGVDNDCSGVSDDGGYLAWYVDADQDGYGAGGPSWACAPPVPGMATRGDDCADGAHHAHPGATEAACDGVDDNCDGTVDEFLRFLAGPDTDGDGFASDAASALVCEVAGAWSIRFGDCDDGRALVNPDMVEGPGLCDGVDNDCNVGTPWDTAEVCGAVSTVVWGGSWYGYYGAALSAERGEDLCSAVGSHAVWPDATWPDAALEIPTVVSLVGGAAEGMYATGITFECAAGFFRWWGYDDLRGGCATVPTANLPPGWTAALEGSVNEDFFGLDPDADLVDNGTALIGQYVGAWRPVAGQLWYEQEPGDPAYILCERELP